MKTLTGTNCEDFTGSRIRIFPTSPTPQQDWRQLKENCEAHFSIWKSQQLIICLLLKFNIVINDLRLTQQSTESQAVSWMPQQAIWRGLLLEGFSQLVSDFIEASQNIYLLISP
jgi:hypothetical protein